MRKKIELLAPGGDIDSIKAAIVAGADAVYCGLNKFNARNRAENISFEDLNGILRLAHENQCQFFLTLNIVIVESEIPDLLRLLNKLINTSIDGIIIQDLGLFYLLNNYFKGLKIHASTQLTTHNKGQIEFLSQLNATRVNLSRELNGAEIRDLTTVAHQNNLLTEVFVHGSYCISFSGICYMSSVHGGNSGNRGRCSQPCRDEYLRTPTGNIFPLNLKDNSAFFNLRELSEAGVDSLKIEGRIKKFHYVYSIVKAYHNQLHNILENTTVNKDNSVLYKVFNRDFSNGYLTGNFGENMFIDNSRDNSAIHFARQKGGATIENMAKAEQELYKENGELRTFIKRKTDLLSTERISVFIAISGKPGTPLRVDVKLPDKNYVVYSEKKLATKGTTPLDEEVVFKRFKAINETEYSLAKIDLKQLQGELFIPFSELTFLKNQILFYLRGSKEMLAPVKIPALKNPATQSIKPALSVLIDSEKDLDLITDSTAKFYFQLPASFSGKLSRLIGLLKTNKTLVPWFSSVLIGEDYTAALTLLQKVRPKEIVTNNTGIAYKAHLLGIPWIAGPFLNSTNSYVLKCLKEKFSCSGAFLSNELNKQQLQRIKAPENFGLHYSIYHPIILMTSRQCFFQTTIGCEKKTMDKHCMPSCSKATTITSLKKEMLFIQKSKGNYNSIYNDLNFMNTKIVADIPNRFSSFLIDLRDIKTNTRLTNTKAQLISMFESYIQGNVKKVEQLQKAIAPTTYKQYQKGI